MYLDQFKFVDFGYLEFETAIKLSRYAEDHGHICRIRPLDSKSDEVRIIGDSAIATGANTDPVTKFKESRWEVNPSEKKNIQEMIMKIELACREEN